MEAGAQAQSTASHVGEHYRRRIADRKHTVVMYGRARLGYVAFGIVLLTVSLFVPGREAAIMTQIGGVFLGTLALYPHIQMSSFRRAILKDQLTLKLLADPQYQLRIVEATLENALKQD